MPFSPLDSLRQENVPVKIQKIFFSEGELYIMFFA